MSETVIGPLVADRRFARTAKLTLKSQPALPPPSLGAVFGPAVPQTKESVIVEISPDTLSIAFDHHKSWRPHPNVGHFKVRNLNEDHRAQIKDWGVKAELRAGYGDNIDLVGTIAGRMDHKHDNTDWISTIEGADGGRGIDFGRKSRSWAAGVSVVDVLNAMAGAMGMSFSQSSQTPMLNVADKRFKHSYSVDPDAYVWGHVQSILMRYGLTGTVQDEQIVVLERDGQESFKATQGQPILLLDDSSGLIGSPEYQGSSATGKPQFLVIKSLLQPSIKIGSKLRLNAQQRKGDFKVLDVHHTGDLYGGDWYTTSKCQALRGGR